MYIDMPREMNVTLQSEEVKPIESCMATIHKLVKTIEKHDCNILESEYGDTITTGMMMDICSKLYTIMHASKMYSD